MHKVSACNAGDLGSIPRSGRSPGGGHGTPLQYSCLENPRDGGAWCEVTQVPGILTWYLAVGVVRYSVHTRGTEYQAE